MADLTSLGRYQLRRVLGRGAMGVVYEGYDPKLNRRVAVKTILRNAAIDAETAQHYSAQFAREAQAAGRLNHPHIVHVHDFAEEGDVAYLVMEYIEGRELRSFFEAREAFTPAEAVRIMGELLDALDYAHGAGIIHRDVKPANVMLDAQQRVKLADFGVARIQDSERSAAGTMVGTPAFMSPEQIQGLKIDRRTDIFSAGTILYQLLTGEQPFTGQGAWTVAKKIMQDDPPHPSSVVNSVSPVFDGIVSKALAKNPAQRFASAKEFAAALRAALAQPAAAATLPPAVPAAARPGAKASDAEIEFWRAIQNSTDAAEFEFYLEQFPDGTYAGLARHKIAKLKGVSQAEDTVRLEAEAAAKRRAEEEKARQEAEALAKRQAEEKARREAAEQAKREAEEKARREAQERARREAEEAAKRVAEEKAKREAQEKAKREAEEKARRETEEKIRQAQALARLKQQEEAAAKAKAKAPADEDSTVALPPRRSEPAPVPAAPAPEAKSKSMAIPAAIAAVVVIGGVAAYLFTGRTPAPAPVGELAPAKPAAAPAAPAVDADKIRRETEERLRKEFAEKATAERATLEKSLAEKIAAEAAAAKKVTEAKSAAEKAVAEKAVAAAAAARVAAEKVAAEKAAADRTAAEKAASERAAADKVAAEKAAAERAAAEKAAAEKVAAEKAAAEKAAAEKQQAAAAVGQDVLLERFIQRVGRGKVLAQEPAIPSGMNALMPLRAGEVAYVNDGSCGAGRIKEITGGGAAIRSLSWPSRCVSLADSKPMAVKPAAASPGAAAAPAAAAAQAVAPDADARLERFIQRVGRDKVFKQEPPNDRDSMRYGEIIYVNDGSCGPGGIREVTGGALVRNIDRTYRCISLADDKPLAVKPAAARPAAAAAVPVAPVATGEADPRLERFIQRVGRDKVHRQEPPFNYASGQIERGQVFYVNDGSCGAGRIREVTGIDGAAGSGLRNLSRPSRCIALE